MRRSWLSTGCCRRCWASPISSSPATQQRGLPAQALVFQPKRVLDVASQRVLAIGLTHRSHWLAELGSSKSAIASAVRPALATRRWRRRARSDPSPEGVSTARPSSTFAPPSPWRSPPFAIPATIATARGSSLRPGPPRILFGWLDCGRFAPGRLAGVGSSLGPPTPFNSSRFMASRPVHPTGGRTAAPARLDFRS